MLKASYVTNLRSNSSSGDLTQSDSQQSPTVKQHSRRYLGNKYKLTDLIRSILAVQCPDCRSFADIFAGTGVVGASFNTPNVRIIANDLLASNHICLQTFLGVSMNLKNPIAQMIEYLNHLPVGGTNYFSYHFGGKYFSETNARKIGNIREEIDQITGQSIERNILLCSLVYAVDKVANTVGHYDAYRRRLDMLQPIQLCIPDIKFANNENNLIFCKDANELIKQIDCDVLYLDPPYNSRQYSDAYHLLENLVSWNKPPVRGVARKMNRSHIKSRYCINGAADALADLVENSNCRHILLSYNNTGQSMDSRSNARISDDEIMTILKSKGKVEIFSKRYKAFSAGNVISAENTERVFYCRVGATL